MIIRRIPREGRWDTSHEGICVNGDEISELIGVLISRKVSSRSRLACCGLPEKIEDKFIGVMD